MAGPGAQPAGGVCALGGVTSAFTIRREPVTAEEADESSRFACPLDAPPMCESSRSDRDRAAA